MMRRVWRAAMPAAVMRAAVLAALGVWGATAVAAAERPAPASERRPFNAMTSTANEDHAPSPAPPGAASAAAELRLGWFGPSDSADPDGGSFWNGAAFAAEAINAAGGAAGRPLRLVPGWSENAWAGGVNRVARMAYDDRVVAILGSIDGTATHLAEQVAAKALITVISPGSTDPTVNLAGVPWMYSVLPGDDVQARALAAHLAAGAGDRGIGSGGAGPGGTIVLVAATDHDARAAAAAYRSSFGASGLAFAAAFDCAPDASDADTVAAQVAAIAPGITIVLAPPAASGRLASALRGAGYGGLIAGGSNLARRRFADSAGGAAAGALVALAHDPEAPRWREFARAYAARFGAEPDFAAGAAWDAVHLAADAARRAGFDPGRLREAVREAGSGGGTGVTGVIAFDRLGRNTRPVRLATIRDGRPVPLAPSP